MASIRPFRCYVARVSKRTPPKKPPRSWRVIIIRSKGEYLGSVEAPDRERAEPVAVKQFALDDDPLGAQTVPVQRGDAC